MRDRYLDTLRALAIVRVVLYHSTGWTLLTVVFPAMGVMFALSGSLMAASLDRHGVRAVSRRARRLLPPLWMIAAVAVPLMIVTGLAVDWRLVLWIVPLIDPPMTSMGASVLGVVWYLRQYLWFVVVSPLLLPLFRRWPIPTILAPYALLAAIEFGLPGLGVGRDFAVYLGCWLIGFAHRDGLLDRARRPILITVAATLSVVGLAWLFLQPGPRGGDLNDVAVANALWSAGFVLAALGLRPMATGWFARLRLSTRLVTLLNRRAVTVYLWHQTVIIGVAFAVGYAGWNLSEAGGTAVWLGLIGVGVAASVLAFGWVEDIAARRRPALLPVREEWGHGHQTSSLSRRRIGAARTEAG